MVLIGILI